MVVHTFDPAPRSQHCTVLAFSLVCNLFISVAHYLNICLVCPCFILQTIIQFKIFNFRVVCFFSLSSFNKPHLFLEYSCMFIAPGVLMLIGLSRKNQENVCILTYRLRLFLYVLTDCLPRCHSIPLILPVKRQRQADFCEFEASQDYSCEPVTQIKVVASVCSLFLYAFSFKVSH